LQVKEIHYWLSVVAGTTMTHSAMLPTHSYT